MVVDDSEEYDSDSSGNEDADRLRNDALEAETEDDKRVCAQQTIGADETQAQYDRFKRRMSYIIDTYKGLVAGTIEDVMKLRDPDNLERALTFQ